MIGFLVQMVRDARRCREGPHPRATASPLSLEERALARVSKDEATALELLSFTKKRR
jgi:hypothetical protein